MKKSDEMRALMAKKVELKESNKDLNKELKKAEAKVKKELKEAKAAQKLADKEAKDAKKAESFLDEIKKKIVKK